MLRYNFAIVVLLLMTMLGMTLSPTNASVPARSAATFDQRSR